MESEDRARTNATPSDGSPMGTYTFHARGVLHDADGRHDLRSQFDLAQTISQLLAAEGRTLEPGELDRLCRAVLSERDRELSRVRPTYVESWQVLAVRGLMNRLRRN